MHDKSRPAKNGKSSAQHAACSAHDMLRRLLLNKPTFKQEKQMLFYYLHEGFAGSACRLTSGKLDMYANLNTRMFKQVADTASTAPAAGPPSTHFKIVTPYHLGKNQHLISASHFSRRSIRPDSACLLAGKEAHNFDCLAWYPCDSSTSTLRGRHSGAVSLHLKSTIATQVKTNA